MRIKLFTADKLDIFLITMLYFFIIYHHRLEAIILRYLRAFVTISNASQKHLKVDYDVS